MKNKISFLLFFAIISLANAQSKSELEARAFFWGDNDNYKNATEIPKKWQNESAVVLYKNVNYDYHKFGKKVKYKTSLRKRIKLLDKNAVEEFSEFSFSKRFRSDKGRSTWRTKGEVIFEIKIVKPDGSEKIIDIDKEAVKDEENFKVAISNLEINDIIDFYYYSVEPFVSKYQYGFKPVETVLGEEYPIVDFKLSFETENDFFINFNSYNNAPELTGIPTEKKNLRKYQLIASNIDKNEFPRWYYPFLELPTYKFQVYFARSGKFEDLAIAFLPKKETTIKNKVSKEEVLEFYDNKFKSYGSSKGIRSFFKDEKFKSDTEKVTAAFYYIRHFELTRFIEPYLIYNAKIDPYAFNYYGTGPAINNQKQFIRYFTNFLKKNKISFEIVVAKKKYDGTIEDLLIEQNVEVLLKINTSTTLYAKYFGPHTSINEFSPYIEGTNAYLLTKSKKRIDGIKKGVLPVSTFSQNVSLKDITITLNSDFNAFNLVSKSSFKGLMKQSQQYDRMNFYDYVYDDYKKYDTYSFIKMIKKKKAKARISKELKALIDKLKVKQKENFEKNAETDYEFNEINDYEFNIENAGRFGLDDPFTYSENFNIENELIKKAGPNYIFEIGKLIGGQIEIEEKDRNRNSNIYMNYARSYDYKINLNIPEGYTIVGLDKLNKKVDNETGAFISSAKIEGNQLIIQTSKQYKHNFEPKENWKLMLAFLDETNQFTDEKILIKKK